MLKTLFYYCFVTYVCNSFITFQDTGEILMPQDLKKAQTYGGRKICFENDEVTEMKCFGEAGCFNCLIL